MKLPTRWLREPLLHFMLLGAAIFAVFQLFGPKSEPQGSIVVTQGMIDGQIASFSRTWLRPPTKEEVDELIRQYVREEVYYREGLALGLDRDDTVIRRRLQQKLEFVAEAQGMAAQPSDDDLRAYLDRHGDVYRRDPRVSFVHVFLSVERRGERAAQDATQLLVALQAGNDPAALGDPTMLERQFEDAPIRDIAAQFGDGFASAVGRLPVGEWQGPIRSSYGIHAVLVGARTEGQSPSLDDVRDTVRRDWLNEQRIAANEKFYQSLLQRYAVTIEAREGTITQDGFADAPAR
jgi:hypothetical protein